MSRVPADVHRRRFQVARALFLCRRRRLFEMLPIALIVRAVRAVQHATSGSHGRCCVHSPARPGFPMVLVDRVHPRASVWRCGGHWRVMP